MPDYKKIYFQLFNQVSQAIEIFQKAQQESEEAYLSDILPPLSFQPSFVETAKVIPRQHFSQKGQIFIQCRFKSTQGRIGTYFSAPFGNLLYFWG